MATTTPAYPRFAHLCPQLSAIYILRIATALILAFVALKVGAGYIHLCYAGSRIIELSAFLGLPVVCLGIVVTVKRLWVGIPISAVLLLLSKLLCQPYLDLVHGPNNPWPAPM